MWKVWELLVSESSLRKSVVLWYSLCYIIESEKIYFPIELLKVNLPLFAIVGQSLNKSGKIQKQNLETEIYGKVFCKKKPHERYGTKSSVTLVLASFACFLQCRFPCGTTKKNFLACFSQGSMLRHHMSVQFEPRKVFIILSSQYASKRFANTYILRSFDLKATQ